MLVSFPEARKRGSCVTGSQRVFPLKEIQHGTLIVYLFVQYITFDCCQLKCSGGLLEYPEKIASHPDAIRRKTPFVPAVKDQPIAVVNDPSSVFHYPQPKIEVFATANALVKHSRFTRSEEHTSELQSRLHLVC